MLPAADLRRLSQLQRLLAEMLAQQNWQRIGELDLLVRQSLERLNAANAITAETTLTLAPLKQLYGQAIQACAVERLRLSEILERHTEHGEGRRAYSLLGSMQGAQ